MTEIDDKETLARSQLPYRAEYCKTSRAKCKKCQEAMEAKSLKLANMTKSRFHDGYDASYYHPKCFFTIKRPTSVAEVANFETLKFDDQKMLEKAIETNGKSLLLDSISPDAKKAMKSSSSKTQKAAKREVAEQLVNYDDFMVEYSKSSRAKCITCEQVIMKGDIRFAKMDFGADVATGFTGPVPRWYHRDCFAKSLEQLDFYGLVENIPNFRDLDKADQKALRKQIKPISPPKPEDVNGTKKVKIDRETKEEEKALREQSSLFYSYMNRIEKMKTQELKELLELNHQKTDIKSNAVLYRQVADMLQFGPLNPCPKCKKEATMLFRNSSYICTQDGCDYETRQPERGIPEITDPFYERHQWLAEDYLGPSSSKRIFPSKFLAAVMQKEAEDNNLAMENAPLQGLDIGIITWAAVKQNKEKIQKRIIALGGKTTTVVAKTVFVILSNVHELHKDSPKMEVARSLGIPFATDEFLFHITSKEDVVPELSKSLIGDWKGNLRERFERMLSEAAEVAEREASQ